MIEGSETFSRASGLSFSAWINTHAQAKTQQAGNQCGFSGIAQMPGKGKRVQRGRKRNFKVQAQVGNAMFRKCGMVCTQDPAAKEQGR